MNLYLMRHANAGLSRENPLLDARRSLVKEGKEQCILMARTLNALKIQVDVIVSSPLKRALQTAQLVGTEMGYDAQIPNCSCVVMNGFNRQSTMSIKRLLKIFFCYKAAEQIQSIKQIAFTNGIRTEDHRKLTQVHFNVLKRLVVFDLNSTNHAFLHSDIAF